MPWRLQKKPKHDLYWVVNKETKVKHSKEPISKEKAEAQKRILEQAEGIVPVVKGGKRRRPKGFENANNMVKPGRLIHLGQVRIPGPPPRGTLEVSTGRVPDPTRGSSTDSETLALLAISPDYRHLCDGVTAHRLVTGTARGDNLDTADPRCRRSDCGR